MNIPASAVSVHAPIFSRAAPLHGILRRESGRLGIWVFLTRAFGSLFVLAGADKLLGVVVPWYAYLAPLVSRASGRPGLLFITIGFIECALGTAVLRRVQVAPVLLLFGAGAIAANFFAVGWYGLGISWAALACGADAYRRLAEIFRRRGARPLSYRISDDINRNPVRIRL